MKNLVKIEFEAENTKEAVSKLKEIQKKILKGITQDDYFDIYVPNINKEEKIK